MILMSVPSCGLALKVGMQMHTPSLRQSNQITGWGQINKRLNEKAVQGEKLSQMLTRVSAYFQAHLWFVASVKKRQWILELCKHLRCTVKKMQVVVMATQGFGSAAEEWVFPPDIQVVILPRLPWSKATYKGQTCFLPPLGTGIQGKSSTFQKHSPAALVLADIIPLCYGFPPPDNIQ